MIYCTVGGIKMVTFLFHLNGIHVCPVPFAIQFLFHVHKWLINTLGVSYQRTCQEPELGRSLMDLESILLHCHCLLNFAWTLCCCCSSDLNMFYDHHLTASNFRCRQLIDLGSLINSNRLYNDWSSIPFGFLGLLWCVVRVSYSLRSRLHHLSPAPPPIQFPFFCWWNGHVFLFERNGTERKHHRLNINVNITPSNLDF